MNDWSLVGEYFALVILMVIALFMYGSKPSRDFMRRRTYFNITIALSALSIILDIVCVRVIENINNYSITFALAINTAYFLVTYIMITVMMYYLFLRVLEFVYDSRHLQAARVILTILCLAFAALAFYNIPSGVLFYFDSAGGYHRGPLTAMSYALPAIEIVLLMICFAVNRKSIGPATERVLFVAAPITLLMMIYQVANPEHLLNGAICSLADLIIFISYKGDREEQDFLTGLDNRHAFTTEILHRTEGKQGYQAIMIKLRHLSRIINTYGQAGCNTVLFQISEMLQKQFPTAEVFRYSDERFALIFGDAIEKHCVERLEKVTSEMNHHWKLGSYEANVGFCAVDIRYRGQDWTPEQVSNYLGNAVHVANAEDNELMPFNEQLFYRYQRRDYILNSIHAAFAEGRFRVWYQPVYYHSSNKFESAEALIRMTDDDGNFISPGEFIPIAEETGLINGLIEIVLEDICRLLGSGSVPELKCISINIPMHQFIEHNLKERFMTIMEKYGVSPHQIKLEITERDVEENGQEALEVIDDLVQSGFKFMLDDFGIAYSNLSRVLALPLDTIKLDRSIVLLLEEKTKGQDIVKNSLVPLFQGLGQNIVAEGVETAQLAEYVLSCGIDRIQGFYYAKPMDEATLLMWYAARS